MFDSGIVFLCTDFCLLRADKVIFCSMTPIKQELAHAGMELLDHTLFSRTRRTLRQFKTFGTTRRSTFHPPVLQAVFRLSFLLV